MCGICGILGRRLNATARREVVQRMMAAVAHRGPDDSALHESSGATLGHQRLSIIDLVSGRQPMASADGRHVIVYNGEIYNYLELREALVRDGVVFRTASDTEVLLELLIREGPAALRRLNGMFAFVLLDTVEDKWLMARDPLGVKPLYFTELPDEIAFGSEPKALLAHPAVRAEPSDLGGPGQEPHSYPGHDVASKKWRRSQAQHRNLRRNRRRQDHPAQRPVGFHSGG